MYTCIKKFKQSNLEIEYKKKNTRCLHNTLGTCGLSLEKIIKKDVILNLQ